MKTYSSLTAFAKNRNTPRIKETYSEFFKGHFEDCKIAGMYCIAYVVFLDRNGKILEPNDSTDLQGSVEYHFRFDPITDKQYNKFRQICEKYGNPEWITLS